MSKNSILLRRKSESTSSETFIEETLHNSPVLAISPTQQEAKDHLLPQNGDDNDSGISESNSEESKLASEDAHSNNLNQHEVGLCRTFFQIFFPFLIAGGGMMLAGMLLDYVQVRFHFHKIKSAF